MEAEKITKN